MQACNPPDLLFLIALLLGPVARGSSSTTTTWCRSCSASRYPSGGRMLYWLTRFVGAPHLRLGRRR